MKDKPLNFYDELAEVKRWLDSLTSNGLQEAEREIIEKINEIKNKGEDD